MRRVQFGRPRKQIPENFPEVRLAREQKKISSRKAAAQLVVAQDTFLRWVKGK